MLRIPLKVFTTADRLSMVQQVLLDELLGPNAEIFKGTACIFNPLEDSLGAYAPTFVFRVDRLQKWLF